MISATIDLLDAPAGTHQCDVARTLRDVRVENLSAIGFHFYHGDPLPIGTLIQIDLEGHSEATARIVALTDGAYHCTFLTPLTVPVFDEDRWPRIVRIGIFLVAGIGAWLAALALVQALR